MMTACAPGPRAPDVVQIKGIDCHALMPVWLGVDQVPLRLLANLHGRQERQRESGVKTTMPVLPV